MPFTKSESGALIWVEPTPESILKTKEEILDVGSLVNEIEINNRDLVEKLDQFVVETLNGNKRLASSNSAVFKAISKIAKIAKDGNIGYVDIIMPVYGGLYIVKECIRTIFERTDWPFRLTIVDDCSPDGRTRKYLEELDAKLKSEAKEGAINHQVIFNNKNKGFAATVNRGIKATIGRYVCVLNSDVLVTNNWLSKMVVALESDPRNKIVNPCTNNTALINVPMQPGLSYIDMNRALEQVSSHRYPEIMPTGFCFMFPRKLTNTAGFFDEGFENYGEETDYWMRTITSVIGGEFPRWKAVLADDTYLFHERGSSFSSLGHTSHMAKRREGSERFHARWPSFKNWQKSFDIKRTMAPIRATLPMGVLNNPNWKYNIAFVTYSSGYCGGMKYISDVVNYLIEKEVNVKVVQIKRDPNSKNIATLGELRTAPIIFQDPKDIILNFKTKVFEKGIVVAVTNELVDIVKEICKDSPLKSVLFAQSHDPLMSQDEPTKKLMEKAYKSVDHIITNAQWLDEYIKKTHQVETLGFVRPGFDNDIFFPRDRASGDDRPTVLFSLLTSYPFKGYDRGISVAASLSKLINRNRDSFRIMAIGPTSTHEVPDVICLGDVAPTNFAKILSTEVDIFVDPSYIHTYGLPSLEAMASGVVPVLWDNHGINEYATHGKDSLIFDNNAPPEALAKEIYALLKDKVRLNVMKSEAVKVSQFRSDSVPKFVETIETNLKVTHKRRNIAVITPHLRKRGGPTTIVDIANKLHDKGHQVDVYTLHSDLNMELLKELKTPIHIDYKSIKKCDLLITNSDNPENEFFSKLKQVNKKILLKLSHNKRFQVLENASLTVPWNQIMTSTQWLADACIKPMVNEGWSHSPRSAKRLGWWHYDHNMFAFPPHQKVFRTLTDLKVPIVVGTLAHHYPLKGTPDAMKVLEIIKAKYGDRVYVYSVGEQEEWNNLKPEWCSFLYSIPHPQIAKAFSETDIWLNCSHTEGLGRMSLEAMSATCAVATTNKDAEYAKDGVNCLVAPVGDIRGLVTAVDILISDQLLRKKIAIGGYETAASYSNGDAYADNLNDLIQEVFND